MDSFKYLFFKVSTMFICLSKGCWRDMQEEEASCNLWG